MSAEPTVTPLSPDPSVPPATRVGISSPGAAGEVPPFVEAVGVSVRVGDVVRVGGIDLRIARGQLVRLVGPAGAGKSLLLRVLAGLTRPSTGTLRIGGADPFDLRRGAGIALRRSLGLLLQDPMLLPEVPARVNVALPACVAGLHEREAADRARRALERAGCDPEVVGDRPVGTLSYSDQQRVALARAMVNRPALLLLDEPTAHLGPEAAAAFAATVAAFVATGVAAVVATQGGYPSAGARDVRLVDGKLA